jgi:hypothetical protein
MSNQKYEVVGIAVQYRARACLAGVPLLPKLLSYMITGCVELATTYTGLTGALEDVR